MNARIEWAQVSKPEGLSEVFSRLEAGTSVGLLPGNDPAFRGTVWVEGPADADTARGLLPAPVTNDCPEETSGCLGLWTSGTTGGPKLVWRPWPALKRGAVTSPLFQGWRWATPFPPWTYAGVQVALQARVSEGTIASVGTHCVKSWDSLNQSRVDALSCTPTYIDLLLQAHPGRSLPNLKQITLGGEVMRPSLGARLRQAFPRVRFSVIYAMTELGLLLRTNRLDGWYELDSLDRQGVAWEVAGDRLVVYEGDRRIDTGDRVVLRNGLIRVCGRWDAVANVAGTKVHLDEVAELAEQVAGIRRALAWREPNTVTGEIVALRYEPGAGENVGEVRARLEAELRAQLPKPAWPRRWEEGPIGLSPNGKRGFPSNAPPSQVREAGGRREQPVELGRST